MYKLPQQGCICYSPVSLSHPWAPNFSFSAVNLSELYNSQPSQLIVGLRMNGAVPPPVVCPRDMYNNVTLIFYSFIFRACSITLRILHARYCHSFLLMSFSTTCILYCQLSCFGFLLHFHSLLVKLCLNIYNVPRLIEFTNFWNLFVYVED